MNGGSYTSFIQPIGAWQHAEGEREEWSYMPCLTKDQAPLWTGSNPPAGERLPHSHRKLGSNAEPSQQFKKKKKKTPNGSKQKCSEVTQNIL